MLGLWLVPMCLLGLGLVLVMVLGLGWCSCFYRVRIGDCVGVRVGLVSLLVLGLG